jgi:hypothetical protein
MGVTIEGTSFPLRVQPLLIADMANHFLYVKAFGAGVAPLCDREQVVFDYSEDRCPADPFHIPDSPVRAFRDDRGRVQLILASRHTRRMIGPELDAVAVEPEGQVILDSHGSEDHTTYDNLEWITATYTSDGQTVHALVHNEYHGWRHFPECKSERGCWLNAVTLATSHDGGASYAHRAAPGHAVATFPYRFVPNTGPMGYFMPSNIVERDGCHYALVRALNGPRNAPAYPAQARGDCLIATNDLSDPAAWRGWDGERFTVAFADPYRAEIDPSRHACRPVGVDPAREGPRGAPGDYRAGEMTESLTYNTHFGCYLLAGVAWKPDPVSGQELWGIYYSLSIDLVEWSERRLLAEAHPFYVRVTDPDRPHAILYPAVLDPASPDGNFNITGRVNDLYFTVFHYRTDERGRCVVDGKNRDLVKLRFEFR